MKGQGEDRGFLGDPAGSWNCRWVVTARGWCWSREGGAVGRRTVPIPFSSYLLISWGRGQGAPTGWMQGGGRLMMKSLGMSFLGPRGGQWRAENGSAEGKVWHMESHWALVRLPVSILPSPAPHILLLASLPVFPSLLPPFLPSCLFFPASLHLFTKYTCYSPSPATEQFWAPVGSSVKWSCIPLPCRVAGINRDRESAS